MSSTIACALVFPLTKTFGHFYSMDTKKVPLIGQVKDAQVALASYPAKRLKLTILMVDIPASYGMLLSKSLYKDMGGKIKLYWSHAIIPIGNKKIKLEPKEKAKSTMTKFDDPKAQILYQEMECGYYMMFFDFNTPEEEPKYIQDQGIWTLEFDGSCATAKSRAVVVLILPKGNLIQLAYKPQFKNTNNIVEYEALLLGISITKKRGVKVIKAQGDAKLIVKQV